MAFFHFHHIFSYFFISHKKMGNLQKKKRITWSHKEKFIASLPYFYYSLKKFQ